MPFLSISGTGIEITLSSALFSLLAPIITCSVIPKDDLYLGIAAMALFLLCFWQIYTFKEVPYSSLLQQQPARFPSIIKNPEDDDNLLEDIPEWTWFEITVAAMAACSVIVSIGAILISTSRIVLLAGVAAIIIPPYAAFQEQKITECKEMEKEIETKDQEMSNLRFELERLDRKSEDFNTNVAKIEDLKEVLEHISEMKNASLDSLEEQIKKSQQILESIQVNKLSDILTNVFDILLADDKDGDMILSDDEIDEIIETIEGLNNVDINDEKAKRMVIDAGRGINAVVQLIKDMLDNDPTTGNVNKDEIFHYK